MNRHRKTLPQALYVAEQISEGERKVAKLRKIEMATLMQQAGKAAYRLLRERWPKAKKILICCGAGNNAGDGYVLARLALKDGLKVDLWQVVSVNLQSVEAMQAYDDFLKAGGKIEKKPAAKNYDVIVDALLGIGVNREVTTVYLQAIEQINKSSCAVLAIDIPSGLNPNTGKAMPICVKAEITISFIALKQGLFTADAADHCGEIVFASLGMQEDFEKHNLFNATLLQLEEVKQCLPRRSQLVHKGMMGKVLCIGGHKSMGGALILSAQAALRAGAGLVTLLCSKQHFCAVLASQPELMVAAWRKKQKINNTILDRANVFVLGPGLGRTFWSKQLFQFSVDVAFQSVKPVVLDADALYWLAKRPVKYTNWVLTPHMQEAARLLNISLADVENDRFSAAKALQQTYGGVVILKGAGSIIYDGNEFVVIHAGNAGMASAGMGDVLTGIIAALFTQGLSLFQAAKFGAFLHSFTADCVATEGQRGLIASDLLPLIGKDISYLVKRVNRT